MAAQFEAYQCLQVERHVIGGLNNFLTQVARVGANTLGSVPDGTLPVLEHADEETELGPGISAVQTRLVDLERPRLSVLPDDELCLALYRRAVPEAMSARFRFDYVATELSKARVPKKGGSPRRGQTFLERASAIQHETNAAGQGPLGVIFDSIIEVSDPVKGLSLTLVPALGRLGSSVIWRQHRLCVEEVARLSPRMAVPANGDVLGVDFARLPADVWRLKGYEACIHGIRGLLPLRLELDRIRAYSRPEMRRGESSSTDG